jgi:GRF zinc finger
LQIFPEMGVPVARMSVPQHFLNAPHFRAIFRHPTTSLSIFHLLPHHSWDTRVYIICTLLRSTVHYLFLCTTAVFSRTMNGINGSTNPRKRRLLLTTSTRKIAAAPPLPASVARLESLLDQPSASSSRSQKKKKKKTDGRANDGPARKKIKTTSTLTTATTTPKYNETMCIPTAPVSVSSNNSATVRRGTLANITTSRPFHSSNVVSSRGATLTLTTKAIRKRLQAIKPTTLANREETRTLSVDDTEAPKKHHSLMPILLSDENSEKPSEEQILTMQKPSTGPTVPSVSFTKASNNRVATSRPPNGLGLKMSKPNRRPIQRQSFTGALPQDVTTPLPEPTNAITHTADDSTNTVTFPNPFTTMAHHPPTSASIFNVTLTAPPPRGHFEKPAPKASRTPVAVNNDNFVRLNLKNNAGACRGARNKSKKFQRRRYGDRGDQGRGNQALHQETLGFSANRNFSLGEDEENEDDQNNNSRTEYQAKLVQQPGSAYVSKMTGMDPMDEFLDGSFHPTKENVQKGSDSINEPDVPNCTRHQRPCKLVTVKKNTTGNKGRKFYVCSMPRGEQCNHFQWADDTAEVRYLNRCKGTNTRCLNKTLVSPLLYLFFRPPEISFRRTRIIPALLLDKWRHMWTGFEH